MIDLELSWHQAGVTAGVLAACSVALRQTRRPRLVRVSLFTQETALVLALFTLWQYAGSFALMGPQGALARSRWIWHAERVVHLPTETSVQRLFLPHPLLIQFFNLYYDSLHFPVLLTTLTWLFVRHRPAYRRLRTTLVVFTASCLAIQLIPVAPPRMLAGTGLVDTAMRYHQSVYGSVAGFNADQLSAMPSVHVGWAVLVAVAIIGTARTRWRWLALAYPVMTTLAVVVTANHFWADGIVAAALLGVVLALQGAGRALLARTPLSRRAAARAEPPQPAGVPVPVPASAPAPATGPGPAPAPGPVTGPGPTPATSGLYPASPTWKNEGSKDPIGIRGSHGDSSPAEHDGSPA